MTTTSIGKIGRLSREVRDELNARIADGVDFTPLLAWLNSLPEVTELVAREFGGRAINSGNLGDWKRGGYENWRKKQEALQLAHDLKEAEEDLAAETSGVANMLGHLTSLVVLELTKLLREASAITDLEQRHKAVIGVARELSKLQRQHLAAQKVKLGMERERGKAECGTGFEGGRANAGCRSASSPERGTAKSDEKLRDDGRDERDRLPAEAGEISNAETGTRNAEYLRAMENRGT